MRSQFRRETRDEDHAAHSQASALEHASGSLANLRSPEVWMGSRQGSMPRASYIARNPSSVFDSSKPRNHTCDSFRRQFASYATVLEHFLVNRFFILDEILDTLVPHRRLPFEPTVDAVSKGQVTSIGSDIHGTYVICHSRTRYTPLTYIRYTPLTYTRYTQLKRRRFSRASDFEWLIYTRHTRCTPSKRYTPLTYTRYTPLVRGAV